MTKQAQVKNAADENQVQEADLRLRFTKRDQDKDMLALLAMPEFRRFAWRHIKETGIFSVSGTCDNYTFFREGARNVGLKLLDEITTLSPDAYLQMITENKETIYE
jgi:hypothetical protein